PACGNGERGGRQTDPGNSDGNKCDGGGSEGEHAVARAAREIRTPGISVCDSGGQGGGAAVLCGGKAVVSGIDEIGGCHAGEAAMRRMLGVVLAVMAVVGIYGCVQPPNLSAYRPYVEHMPKSIL